MTRPEEPTGRHLGWLDQLKGLAMLWIVLNHISERIFGYPWIANPSPDWPALTERVHQLAPLDLPGIWWVLGNLVRWTGWIGDQGVQIFLIASGFGLAWWAERHGGFSARRFWAKRLLRIYPMWWMAHLLVFFVGYMLTASTLFPTDSQLLPSLLGLRITPDQLYYGSPSWWYIGLLLQLYAVFPLLWSGMQRWGGRKLLLLSLLLMIVVRAAALFAPGAWMDAILRGSIFPSRLPEFVFGMVLAVGFARNPQDFAARLGAPSTLLLAGAAWISGMALSLTTWGMTIAVFVIGASAFVLFRALLVRVPLRGLGWIGVHSYALYLVHQLWVDGLVPGGLEASATVRTAGILLALVMVMISGHVLEWTSRVVEEFVRQGIRDRAPGRLVVVPALIAAVGIAALLGLEALVRSQDPQEVLGWGERPALMASEEFGWTLRPGYSGRLRWEGYDYGVEATEEGFPQPECAPGASPALRILTLGDAFSSAEGVEPDESWPRVLEKDLAGTFPDVEVCNFAVTGHGPTQYAAIANHFIPELRPDLVLVGLFANDFLDVDIRDEDFRASIGFGNADPGSWTQWCRLVHLRRWIRTRLVDRFRDRWLGDRDPRGWYLSNLEVLERDNTAIETEAAPRVEEALRKIAEVASGYGCEVRLLLFPAPVQVAAAEDLDYLPHGIDPSDTRRFDQDRPQRLALGIAHRMGVMALDLRPALGDAPAGSVFFPFNMHWTPDAHARVAAAVARWLTMPDSAN